MNKYSEDFLNKIKSKIESNNGKLSFPFIMSVAESAQVTHIQPTPNMRLCILTLPSGHEVLGKAQVLDSVNDVKEIGEKVAYDNAVNELWSVCGSIAKLYI